MKCIDVVCCSCRMKNYENDENKEVESMLIGWSREFELEE
jgi:hypothetical protein